MQEKRSAGALLVVAGLCWLAGAGVAGAQPGASVPVFGKAVEEDFNGDGLKDRAEVRDGQGLAVAFGTGEGKLSDSELYPAPGIRDVGAAKVDDDSSIDLVTVSKTHETTVLLNDGLGSFSTATSATLMADPAPLGDVNMMTVIDHYSREQAISKETPVAKPACDVPREYRPAVCSYFHRMYCHCITGRLHQQIPADAGFWQFFKGCSQFNDQLYACECWNVKYNWPPEDENCFSWVPQAFQ